MDALLVLIMATLERVFGRKKEKHRLTDEIYLTVKFSTMLLDMQNARCQNFEINSKLDITL